MNKFIESMSSLGEESQTEDSSETTTSSSTSSDDSEDEAMSPRDFRVSASFFIWSLSQSSGTIFLHLISFDLFWSQTCGATS